MPLVTRMIWISRRGTPALLLALAACSARRAADAPPTGKGDSAKPGAPAANDFVAPQGPRGIVTAPVRTEILPDYLDVPGRIQADPTRLVRVYAPVSGRLVSVDIRPAELVQQGQVLATLASSEVAVARAAYRQAEADAEVKQQDVERAHLLWKNDAIAQRDVQQAEADARMAAAALESARERLALLSVDTLAASDEIPLRAPRSGVVLDVGAAPGQFLKSLDNSDPLCTVADLTVVWAVGDVYELDIASLRVGDGVQVLLDAYPGKYWAGRIDAIGGAVDSTTRALQVRVVLPNPGLRLKPDMFASLRVARPAQPAIVLPATAAVREGTSAYVFVETSPDHFARRPVTLGRDLDSDRVLVTTGLAAGEVVVVQGADLLRLAASGGS